MAETYKFPDEQDDIKVTAEDDAADEKIIVEVEDDTPSEDRNKDPLPDKIKEELYNDELEDYSTKVKKKLIQMKKLAHDERREKENAMREQNEAIAFAQKVMEENKRLKSNLNNSEKNVLVSVQKAVAMEMDAAKKAYREAYDSGDTDKVMEAQERLTQATLKVEKVKNFRPQPLQEEETPVQMQPQQEPQYRPDPSAQAWQRENAWFGEDEEMTSLALGLHERLKREGVQVSSQEYYRKIDATIRKRFPEKFEDEAEQEERPAVRKSVVAPATRTTSAKRIRLSPSELSVAKKLNLTPEQYAKAKIQMEA
jgi:hypothetical protein|tara:strand:+ start:6515 stop:7447 length:933 start_codon:yes stop_codon:yes gene_type:complete